MDVRLAGGLRVSAGLVAVCVAMMFALAGCSAGGQPSSSSSSAGSSSASESASAAASGGNLVTIGLDYNAGTGYEWTYEASPEGVLALASQETESHASSPTVSGGALREVYRFEAVGAGEVVVTFRLVRPWEEGQAAEEQVYAFTVGDAGIVLNPYKSNFDNEPQVTTS